MLVLGLKSGAAAAYGVVRLARSLFLLVEKRQLPSGVVIAIRDYKGALTVSVASPEWWSFIEPYMQLAWRGEDEHAGKVVAALGERWD